MKDLRTNEELFNQIYNDTFTELRRFVQRKSKNPVMVDDILQEVYIEVFRHIKDLRKHENVVGWVYKTAGNKTKKLNELYNRHMIREITIEEWNGAIDEKEVMRIVQVDEYQSVLKEDEFQLLMLKYVEGYSHKELAEIAGISEGNSKIKLSRIVNKLRKNMKIRNFLMIIFF